MCPPSLSTIKMSLFVEILYYFIFAFTRVKQWVIEHYQQMYKQQSIVSIRRFDVLNNRMEHIFYISWLQHFYAVARYMASCPVTYEPIMSFAPSTMDYYFYEYTFWNGAKTLVRAQGALPPCDPSPSNSIGQRFLYVGMGNKDHVCDVTDQVNPFVSSFTIANHITAQDLFYMIALDGTIHVPKALMPYNGNLPIIDIEFVMCDEIIEKVVFVGDEVIHF